LDLDAVTAFLSEQAAAFVSSPRQMLAHGAAAVGIGLVVLGAFARTMMPLRWLAVGSNVGLVIFGALHPSTITLLTAAALLPINTWRAVEITRLTRRVQRAKVAAEMAGLWLKPYMKARKLKPGQTLFRKDDRADRLYMLAEGEMVLAEINQPLEAGRIFGEIALFSPHRIRTQTVRAVTACTVLEIDEGTVRQLYYQNPSFGFHLIELLASRLSTDVERASHR
jgi:hypothetical protein